MYRGHLWQLVGSDDGKGRSNRWDKHGKFRRIQIVPHDAPSELAEFSSPPCRRGGGGRSECAGVEGAPLFDAPAELACPFPLPAGDEDGLGKCCAMPATSRRRPGTALAMIPPRLLVDPPPSAEGGWGGPNARVSREHRPVFGSSMDLVRGLHERSGPARLTSPSLV